MVYPTYAPFQPPGPMTDHSLRLTIAKTFEITMIQVIANFMWIFFINEERLAEKARLDNPLDRYATQQTFGFGVEGFRDRSQYSDQPFSFYPAVKTDSKFN